MSGEQGLHPPPSLLHCTTSALHPPPQLFSHLFLYHLLAHCSKPIPPKPPTPPPPPQHPRCHPPTSGSVSTPATPHIHTSPPLQISHPKKCFFCRCLWIQLSGQKTRVSQLGDNSVTGCIMEPFSKERGEGFTTLAVGTADWSVCTEEMRRGECEKSQPGVYKQERPENTKRTTFK